MEDSKSVELEFPTRGSFSSTVAAATDGRKATMQPPKVVAIIQFSLSLATLSLLYKIFIDYVFCVYVRE
jgi:hypothetical protein